MEQLNVLSAQIIWAHKAERAEKTYNEAKAALAELTAQMASLDKWMDITLSKYDALAKQYDKRENRLASMEAMNVDYNLRYNVQSEMYQLESDFYSLQSEVEQQRGDLDWDADSVKRDIRDVNKFCSESGALADQVPFCKQLPARVDELDALNVNLRNLFRKWDSRQSRAPAK
jgi:chromosome segregation ATPase